MCISSRNLIPTLAPCGSVDEAYRLSEAMSNSATPMAISRVCAFQRPS
jgi:hypothetical protein